jgi:CheY-like chemotaxis protein
MSPSKSTSGLFSVLIIDQHDVSRAAIRALLRTEGLDVVADVAGADQALAIGDAVGPDIALVDLGSEPRRAIRTARALARLRSAPTVVLTSSTPAGVDLDGFAFVAKQDICAVQLRRAMRPQRPDKEPHMSMQAYLANITATTGSTPEELIEHARAEGLIEPGRKAGRPTSTRSCSDG